VRADGVPLSPFTPHDFRIKLFIIVRLGIAAHTTYPSPSAPVLAQSRRAGLAEIQSGLLIVNS